MIVTWKFWIGIAITILLLMLFVATVDVGRMIEAVAEANYLFLIPGIGMYLISVLLRTVRWQLLLRHMRHVAVTRLYPVVVVGYMANNLLPMRIGELVRSYYLGEREGISKTSALVTILVERVLDALTLLFFIAGVGLFVPLAGLADAFARRFGIASGLLVAVFTLPFIMAFGVLLLFAYLPGRTKSMGVMVGRLLPARFEEPVRNLVEMFLDGLIPLRSPRTLLLLFTLSAPIWLFEAGLFFFVGFSFELEKLFSGLGEMAVANILVTSTANLGSSVPAAPGGIGLFELVTRETLVLLPLAQIERSVAGAFAAVVHAALLLPMIILGQVFLWAGHASLGGLARAERAVRPTQDMEAR